MVNDVKHYPEEPNAHFFHHQSYSSHEMSHKRKLNQLILCTYLRSVLLFVNVSHVLSAYVCSRCLLQSAPPCMPAFANACLVCPCVVSECVSVLTPPALPFHPSLQSACEIWSSNCQAWTPHSFHGPANQHCVTLTTANYHCDGELSLTVALGEYGCISLNKSAQLPTHTPSHCCLTRGFSTLLHLAQNVRLS